MSLAVWLGEDRTCSAAVVGLDLLLGLSIVRRCSLNRSFNRRFVSPMYCKLQRLHWAIFKTRNGESGNGNGEWGMGNL